MKALLFIVIGTLLVGCAGCTSFPAVVKAVGESPAAVRVNIRTVYGTLDVVRLNPTSNTPPYQLTKDGEITVKGE